jgi:hypothetical protein
MQNTGKWYVIIDDQLCKSFVRETSARKVKAEYDAMNIARSVTLAREVK